jgi:protein involved in polysaccharide export with SLBB domain
LKVNANASAITLYRMDLNTEGTTTTTTISLDENLVPSNNVLLQPDDYVIVRIKSGYQTIETVTLNGEVKNRGVYALKNKNYSLFDLIRDADGFLDEANLKGITVTRSIVQAETNQKALSAAATNTSEASIAGLLSGLSGDRVVIGIDGEKLMNSGGLDQKNNIILKEGDEIYVSKLDNTIFVVGTVQQNSKQVYSKGLTVKQVINNSGGYGERPNRKNVYVVYQNGSIKKRSRCLGFRFDPRLEPGSTVVVPRKAEKERSSVLGETVGYVSTLATLALLIKQLGI